MKRMRFFLILVIVVLNAAVLAFGFYPPQTASGKVILKQADGTVTVNGTSAISGATVFSDSTVTTGQKSSAVVSLGKLGRVELVPETTVKITYTGSSVTLNMHSGATGEDPARKAVTVNGTSAIRWTVDAGVAGTAITNDAQVIPDSTKKTEATIDTSCGNTFVAVKKGSVTLRAGDTVKQIAAGGSSGYRCSCVS